MALIRCPQCDTLHDLEGSFFANGPRKVRCAECRTVWEARDPASTRANAVVPSFDIRTNSAPKQAPVAELDLDWDLPDPPAPAAKAEPAKPEPAKPAAMNQAEIDAFDFSMPAEPQAEDRAISAEELEALFADDPKPAPAARKDALESPIMVPPAMAQAAQPEMPVDSLKQGSDDTDEQEERRANRRRNRLAAAEAHHQNEAKAAGRTSMTGIVLAAGIGSLAMLGILRHETVRLFPQTAPFFAAVGLGVSQHQLDIDNVRSRLTKENGIETLEVTGSIANITKSAQKIPILRLSIRSQAGQEIYVWTATADQGELGPGEKTMFRRRLASPPADSHSVMVRFVAKDDIVAAIR
jgi:hypothetical protein